MKHTEIIEGESSTGFSPLAAIYLPPEHFNRGSSHFKTLQKKHQGSINVIMLL